MKRELERIEIPGEHEARERAWALAQRAFAEREPTPPRRRLLVPALVALAAAIVVAAALSPPGRAVLGDVRDAVLPTRIERAQPALFSLPEPGRLLVVSAEGGGVWIVQADGSKRRIGDYEDARWSPFGRFVVATRPNALLALTPEGEERWSLARRGVRGAVWGGGRKDTRIAYVADSGIRVVGGDGRGDRLLVPGGDGPLAWRPGAGHVLAYVQSGQLRLQDVDSGRIVTRTPVRRAPTRSLSWSSDGRRLAVVGPHEIVVVDSDGRLVSQTRLRHEVVAASFAPRGHELAVLSRAPGLVVSPRTPTVVRLLLPDRARWGRRLLAERGDLGELAWAPNGEGVLTTWRSRDGWVYLRRGGWVTGFANIAAQFPRPDGRPPLLLLSDRWCCAD